MKRIIIFNLIIWTILISLISCSNKTNKSPLAIQLEEKITR